MMKIGVSTWVMAAAWLLVSGLGVYYTFFRQPEELEHLRRAEQLTQMKNSEYASLRAEEASLAMMADDAVRKWRARYKVIPQDLRTPDVVAYLNELTQSGFKNFDVTLGGRHQTPDYSYFVFNVTGRGYFNSLYRLVWELENNRYLYRVRDLSLDHIDLVTTDRTLGSERLQVMVSFNGRIEAYFDAVDGAGAPEEIDPGLFDERRIVVDQGGHLPPVPMEMLPDARPATNPFYPVIMERIPPNTYGLLDVESAEFLSIAGTTAVFRDQTGIRSVSLGDRVYLGEIVEVNAAMGRVVARLNKGGIIDTIERALDMSDRYRQALGPARLTPIP